MVRLRPLWMTNHPPSVLWHCWLGHQTCKNRRPYNLYCVGADVKPCSINQSPSSKRLESVRRWGISGCGNIRLSSLWQSWTVLHTLRMSRETLSLAPDNVINLFWSTLARCTYQTFKQSQFVQPNLLWLIATFWQVMNDRKYFAVSCLLFFCSRCPRPSHS